jgi:DNA polymerase
MHSVLLGGQTDLEGWRGCARRLVLADVPPQEIAWSVAEDGAALFPETAAPSAARTELRVPRAFLDLAGEVIQHRDPERFALLYRMLWRIHGGERHLLEDAVDTDVRRTEAMARHVRRDGYTMKAFLRFRTVEAEGGPHFLAWFEPEHFTLDATAPFFVQRFANMRWSILTPYRSAHWDEQTLNFGPGASKADVPGEDALEAYWRSYYASIFNPARVNIPAMAAQMPRKLWKNLPEAPLIAPLANEAGGRSRGMIAKGPTEPALKGRVAVARGEAVPAAAAAGSLDELRGQAAGCRACPLWAPATQTVFGEGPQDARIMLVGEQPGDQEDLAGRPFVGPAGQLFDQALGEAGLDRAKFYVTNAVKHFKFVPRGKRRVHSKPGTTEIQACGPWLAQEIALLRPALIVALGGTAAKALLGRDVTVTRERGRIFAFDSETRGLITVHPSYMLRIQDEAEKAAEYRRFVADLRLAAALPEALAA